MRIRLSLCAKSRLLVFLALLSVPPGVAWAQYNQPYRGPYADVLAAQQLDSVTRENLRRGLQFDYGELRKKRNAAIVLSLVGVSAELVGTIILLANDADYYDMPGAATAHFSGLAMACVGIPFWIVNGVRMDRVRRDYFFLTGRRLEHDFKSGRKTM